MIEELGFKLGDKVVDKQTGFTGIATTVCFYVAGDSTKGGKQNG